MDQHFSLSQMDVILVPFWTGEVNVKRPHSDIHYELSVGLRCCQCLC